jgi:hypothetical protein
MLRKVVSMTALGGGVRSSKVIVKNKTIYKMGINYRPLAG